MSQSRDAGVAKLEEGELPEIKVLNHLGLVTGMFEELEAFQRRDFVPSARRLYVIGMIKFVVLVRRNWVLNVGYRY
jgi:hypothetical protein